MNTTLTVGLADIVKYARDENGNLVVTGKVTGPDLDLDEQVCDPAWLKTAVPQWFDTGGNVREQHDPKKAAGVATTLTASGDDYLVDAVVVDQQTAAKVEAKVLKGFSVGIKNPRIVKDASAPGGRITDGTIVEVSLVDRPCNPTCKATIAKAAGPEDELEDLDEIVIEENPEAPDGQEAVAAGTADEATDEADKALVATITKRAKKARKFAKAAHTMGNDGPLVFKWDAAQYAKAWAALSSLVAVEAAEMGRGDDEIECLRTLTDALSALKYYRAIEVAEGEVGQGSGAAATADGAAGMPRNPLAGSPTTDGSVQAVSPAPAPARPGQPSTDITHTATIGGNAHNSGGSGATITVKAAPESERIKALEVELAEVKKLAAGGGPVRSRPVNAANEDGAQSDKAATAAWYRQCADRAASDPGLAEGYRQLAEELEAELATT